MSGADAPSDEGELHPGNYRPLMSEQRAQRIRRWHEGAYCRAKDSLGGRQMWPVSNAVNTAGIRSTRVSAKSYFSLSSAAGPGQRGTDFIGGIRRRLHQPGHLTNTGVRVT